MKTEKMWKDGKPTNLVAAALDALEWLNWFYDRANISLHYRQRLDKCIEELDNHIASARKITDNQFVDANKKEEV